MKIVTWLIYISIFIFSAIYVFKHEKYIKRIEIINGYAVNFSVNRGEDLEFYLNPQVAHKKGVVCIYDVHHKIVDSLILNLKKQATNLDTLLYEHGYQYTNKFKLNTASLKSGIYFLGNVVPFLVKEPQLKNSITVVFPYANFMALSNEGGKSFDAGNSSHGIAATKLSLNRSLWMRNSPLLFINWLDSIYQNKSINYISDLDLEVQSSLNNSNLLILYGYSSFWTTKQRYNLDQFIDSGGNVLAICTNLMNNKFQYNSRSKSIVFSLMLNKESNLTSEKLLGLWGEIQPNSSSIGCSYETGYLVHKLKSSFNGFKIVKSAHPIFFNMKDSLIFLDNTNSNSIAVVDLNFKTFPEALPNVSNFIKKEILAFDYSVQNNKQTITGIFLMQRREQSGKLLIIGNEKWCWGKYFNTNSIQLITKNCINYLSS